MLCKWLLSVFLMLMTFTFTHAQNSRSNPAILSIDSLGYGIFLDLNWKYTIGDDYQFKNIAFDDATWEHNLIINLDTLKPQQIAWLRYYFKVDSSLLLAPIFLEIKQQGASEIFLNGKKIDSLGIINAGATPKSQNTRVPAHYFSVADTGLQVLAVRYQKAAEGEESNLGKFDLNGISINFKNYELAVVEPFADYASLHAIAYLITGIFAALGFIHLLMFAFFRKATYNFFFGTYNLSIALMAYCVDILMTTQYVLKENKLLDLLFIGFALFAFSLTGFVNTLFGKSKIRKYILLAVPLLCMGLYYIESDLAAAIMVAHIFIVALESFFLIIRAMLRKEKSAFIVGGGILVFFCVILVLIIALVLNGGHIDGNTSIVGKSLGPMFLILIVSFPISISAYLAWQFSSTNLKLQSKLEEVETLSAYSLKQEQEKQQILENQNENLEVQVLERTRELQLEKQKSDDLLLNILPQEVAEELKQKGESKAQQYDEVSVLFTDFVNFTSISEKLGVDELLAELNANFTAFDQIMEKHGLEKIKTIGDAYLAVSGLPVKNERHAQNAVAAALEIIEFVEARKDQVRYGLDIRIGINSGALIAGIVGVKKFAFDIWGDTVNTAARMEQNSMPGKVNIATSTFELVKNEFDCEHRGKLNAKGKGELDMYFVKHKI